MALTDAPDVTTESADDPWAVLAECTADADALDAQLCALHHRVTTAVPAIDADTRSLPVEHIATAHDALTTIARLRHRDRSCSFPTCNAPPLRLQNHHIIHWDDHGTTDPPPPHQLCRAHHADHHARGWRIQRHPPHHPPRRHHHHRTRTMATRVSQRAERPSCSAAATTRARSSSTTTIVVPLRIRFLPPRPAVDVD